MQPVLRDRSPLRLFYSYENCLGYGLLPTPKIRPLRWAIWTHHPVIEIEHALNQAKNDRVYSLLSESLPCEYAAGIFLRYLSGIYGEKIARISSDAEEAKKRNLVDDFSPRTAEIYRVLGTHMCEALNDQRGSSCKRRKRKCSTS